MSVETTYKKYEVCALYTQSNERGSSIKKITLQLHLNGRTSPTRQVENIRRGLSGLGSLGLIVRYRDDIVWSKIDPDNWKTLDSEWKKAHNEYWDETE